MRDEDFGDESSVIDDIDTNSGFTLFDPEDEESSPEEQDNYLLEAPGNWPVVVNQESLRSETK
ncbi:hypothetical protein J6590_052481 [Homalodisca vitripennis]|nr:hypothetical protein J6590_052481 [Homalodisca vitripennis]